MSSFVAMSACKGQRPSGLVSRYQYERPHLLGRLLRERHVARFLVAPEGYGKTALAFAYADLVFSFNRVNWINCKSPCFIRDIDSGSIVGEFRALKPMPNLVVFEDLPLLSDERARIFSSLVDTLLEMGCEAVVTCLPSCDVFAGLHRDRILISAHDLMLDDTEVGLGVGGARVNREVLAGLARADRVPCLRWREEGEASFAAGIASEDLPADVTTAMISMLVLQHGDLDDLRMFVPSQNPADALAFLSAHYPHLGIDVQGGAFDAASISAELLAAPLLPQIERVAPMTHFGDRDTMMSRFADALVARMSYKQAADVLAHLVTRAGCVAWLKRRGWDLLAEGAVGDALRLCEHVLKDTSSAQPEISVLAAWSALILDDREAALAHAKRVAFGRSARDIERAVACLLLAHCADAELKDRAREALGVLVTAYEACATPKSSGKTDGPTSLDERAWMGFSRVVLESRHCPADSLKAWMSLFAAEGGPCSYGLPGARKRSVQADLVLTAAATYVLGNLKGAGPLESDVHVAACVVAEYLFDRIDELGSLRLGIGWFDIEAARVLEDLAETGTFLEGRRLPVRALSRIRQAELSLFAQRSDTARARAERERRAREFCDTHPDPFRNDMRVLRGVQNDVLSTSPMLRVNLFGGFVVKIGEQQVGDVLLRNRKVRLMLAILVLNSGRDIPRDRLARMLWPNSTPKAALKSFYGAWVKLTRALSIEGSCPYLIRKGGYCRLDARLLSSDVADFDDMCRRLLVGKVSEWEWESLAYEIGESYAGELMPGEYASEELCMERDRRTLQLIDALVHASSQLLTEGEVQGALWLAREAWHRDLLREDSCMALMHAQVAAGQRGAAIDTFFTLKKRLSDELGLDPSPEIMSLYADILSADLVPA